MRASMGTGYILSGLWLSLEAAQTIMESVVAYVLTFMSNYVTRLVVPGESLISSHGFWDNQWGMLQVGVFFFLFPPTLVDEIQTIQSRRRGTKYCMVRSN
ncbi:hypothetical protein PAXRUDRAFT_543684 [Paxillus rubicundulus Ve08.2h10]|uniref:Uncharacterized protein n=1 Tax=Paxillus rubicundulus Ve08.2h10 TaxID=930991 RepID=A0A0D0D7X9_9AGAM|nr:hypothetical protein PAXRUDRAFT_543684 [Paxillus rubicundulus Ve08.2h10]